MLDDWQRIEKIVRWTGLSVNSFALSIGLNRSENLYRIKRGDNGISKELAELIAAMYPEISRAWIITGEGGMFIGNTEERNLIPAYDIDALTLAGMERFPEESYVLSLPRAEHVTFAALMLTQALEPEIPVGATLLLSETEESCLLYTSELPSPYPPSVSTHNRPSPSSAIWRGWLRTPISRCV